MFDEKAPFSFWNSETEKSFFDWLGKQLKFNSLDEWYKITAGVIGKFGGSGALGNHNNSPLQALQAIYPEHNWIPWKFNTVPRSYWENLQNQKSFFDWVAIQLNHWIYPEHK